VYTEILSAIARHAEDRDIPVADHIGHALKLKLRNISPSQDSYDQFLHLCDKLAAAEQSRKYTSSTGDLDIYEPK